MIHPLVLLLALAQTDGVSRYVAAHGAAHYTNEQPPAAASRVDLDKAAVSHVPRDRPKPREEAPVEVRPATPRASLPDPDEVYWRDRFRAAHQRIRVAQAVVVEEQRRYDET